MIKKEDIKVSSYLQIKYLCRQGCKYDRRNVRNTIFVLVHTSCRGCGRVGEGCDFLVSPKKLQTKRPMQTASRKSPTR